MKQSSLQLESFFITKACVTANLDFADTPKGGEDSMANISVGMSRAAHEEDPRKWQVDVMIIVKSTKEYPSPYDLDISVRGFFKVSDNVHLERAEAFVVGNGPLTLYCSAREVATLLMSRGPHPAFVLPSVTFVDDARKLDPAVHSKSTKADKVAAALPPLKISRKRKS